MMNYPFLALNLRLTKVRTLLWTAAFIIGNLALPYACHAAPIGNLGYALLPIYFFTLIAAYKFGFQVGLITAVISPLVNNLLFGMPPFGALPIILLKSALLAGAAAMMAHYSHKISLLRLLIVVAAYQAAGAAIELLYAGADAALAEFRCGWLGMILQVVGGFLVLRILAKYD
jgi:hypothetical protein